MKTKTPDLLNEKCVKEVEEASVSLEIWTLNKDQHLEFIAKEHKIVLVTSGRLTCLLSGYTDENIEAGQMIFISIGSRCLISTTEGASAICLKPGLILNLYNYSNYSQFSPPKELSSNKPVILSFTPIISVYAESLKWFLNMNFRDALYICIKIRELFYLMSICYTLQERSLFFQSLASRDNSFSDFIYQNYREVKSISELASLSCYSRSGFEKRFRKIFGVPASHWITLRKAADIYHEIRRSRKSIKQICFDYSFSSMSHFHKFCKSKFGLSPGYIRKQTLIEGDDIKKVKK
ncbi:AraC family transcriptional regulator [uncultured Dysgonomonas sp.]|uniref:helix-turn-helix domain-containing protein n=1 Tax=uncultured Dysgonomonas sp. TaxID=206096 RepID=UPI002804738B|nr:AraC family transcriptional regulator [uncultured Dysgonomonas sp.]